jgi:uncharacterized protein (DUF58 family)
MRRGIGIALAAKLAALLALWALFFSPAQRADVTAEAVDRQLEIGEPGP